MLKFLEIMKIRKIDVQPEAASTKARIVQTALTLFKERGLAGVSTRDVGEACGLSRSHLYHYFADWDALRNGVFSQLAASELSEASQLLDALPPTQAMVEFVKAFLPINRDSSWMLWLDAWDEALRDDAFAEIYLSAMQQWETILGAVVQRGVKTSIFQCDMPERAAKQIFAMINGYSADLLLVPSPRLQKAAVRDVLEVAALLLKAKL
jgi:AcrR family transcriptional regulator